MFKSSVASYKVLTNDLVNDCESFFKTHKGILANKITNLYQRYLPEPISDLLSETYEFWKSHSSYKVYKDNEDLVNNSLMVLGAILTIKLVKSLFSSLLFSKRAIESVDEAQLVEYLEQQEYYRNFETIPICIGKENTEEILYNEAIAEMKGKYTEEYTTEIEYLTSTPTGLEEPAEILSPQSNSRSTTTSNSEDSFEKHENSIDRKLSNLNSTSNYGSTNTRITPQPSTVFNIAPNLSTPKRDHLFKKSISLLTPQPAPVTVSVGDITQETVYSEPFSSDESLGSPIHLSRKGKKPTSKKRKV